MDFGLSNVHFLPVCFPERLYMLFNGLFKGTEGYGWLKNLKLTFRNMLGRIISYLCDFYATVRFDPSQVDESMFRKVVESSVALDHR